MSLGIDFPGYVNKRVEAGMPVQQATSLALSGYLQNIRLFDAISRRVRVGNTANQSAVIVAASGNESERNGTPPYTIAVASPAASDDYISVGAVDRDEKGDLSIAYFSNAGAMLAAPGVGIPSAKAGGGFIAMDGTSMATPHVAGVAALWAEKLLESNGGVDGELLSQRLVGNSQQLPNVQPDDIRAGLVRAPTS